MGPQNSYAGAPDVWRKTYILKTIYGTTNRVPVPPKRIPGKRVSRNIRQDINFNTTIGGEGNARFTLPIETHTGYGDFQKTELGQKTTEVGVNTSQLTESFNEQKETLDVILANANDFLSRNQFIN